MATDVSIGVLKWTNSHKHMNKSLTIFFDLDETLLDGSSYQDSLIKTSEALIKRNPSLSHNQILEANRRAFRKRIDKATEDPAPAMEIDNLNQLLQLVENHLQDIPD